MNEPVATAGAVKLRQLVKDGATGPIEKSFLRTLIRQQYVFHAAQYARVVNGASVLPALFKSDVASLVWFDATGNAKPPKSATRTSTLTSIGVYLSRFAAVASDPDRGLEALGSDESFIAAEAAVVESSKARKEALVALAFEDFQNRLTSDQRSALETVRSLLRDHEDFAGLIIRDLRGTEN